MATMSQVKRADVGHAPTSAPAEMRGPMTKRQLAMWQAGNGRPLGTISDRRLPEDYDRRADAHACGWDASGPAELTLAEKIERVRQRAAEQMLARRAAALSPRAYVVRR